MATLKPQAGLVAPQVAPASQPAAVVSVHLDVHLMSCQASCVWLIDFVCLFGAQGAGGEPMDVNEQVGMTPEIIQKVSSPPQLSLISK